MHDALLSPYRNMKAVARQITERCLRRWDGILRIRAGSHGLGRRSGIWRDRFDGVRYAVLLLDIRKLNKGVTSVMPKPSELWPPGMQQPMKHAHWQQNQLWPCRTFMNHDHNSSCLWHDVLLHADSHKMTVPYSLLLTCRVTRAAGIKV